VRVRDHLVDVRLSGYEHVTDLAGRPVDIAPYRETLARGLGDHFIDACLASMSPTEVRCALDAKTTSAITSCAAR